MDKYEFNLEDAFNRIQEHWRKWAASVDAKKWVIGISGGKDSTVVAALAARIFGKESVVGVMMPNNMPKMRFVFPTMVFLIESPTICPISENSRKGTRKPMQVQMR